jgi:hypothetical protein
MEITVITEPVNEEIKRSVSLSNEDWGIIALCLEAYAGTHRSRHSEKIATYCSRGQLDKAVEECAVMNQMLQALDKLQVKVMS